MRLICFASPFFGAAAAQAKCLNARWRTAESHVKEDHRAPVVVQQIWYKAGSMDERTGVTGIAHVLEHLMFKGTQTVPAGEFSKRIAAAGGRENAFTSYDYTAYFQQLHKSKLPLAMQLESDRMRNLNLTAADFAKEIKVVMEERRLRTDDEPQSLMHEVMMATIIREHPYHHRSSAG